jgi:hypothetical protein
MSESIQGGLNSWLAENWKLLLVVALVISWGARIEGRTDDRYTGAQAMEDKTALAMMLEIRLDKMSHELAQVKADTAYLRGRFEAIAEIEGEQ